MNEDMNRFAFNTEGKICDYGEEEPKVLTEQEILEELNRLDQANYELSSECTSVNWTNEFLGEQVEVLERALDLACETIDEHYRSCCEGIYSDDKNWWVSTFKKQALTKRGKQ